MNWHFVPKTMSIRRRGILLIRGLNKARAYRNGSSRAFATSNTALSEPKLDTSKSSESVVDKPHAEAARQISKKPSTADLDEELRKRMDGLSGDGGEAGVEYEDGKPVAMKRSVKNNMFRYI